MRLRDLMIFEELREVVRDALSIILLLLEELSDQRLGWDNENISW